MNDQASHGYIILMLHLSADAVIGFSLFQIWYDIHSKDAYEGGRTLTLPVTLNTVSVSYYSYSNAELQHAPSVVFTQILGNRLINGKLTRLLGLIYSEYRSN